MARGRGALSKGGGRTGAAALQAAVNVPQAAASTSPNPSPVYGSGAALAQDRAALPTVPPTVPAAPPAPAPYAGPMPGSLPSPTDPTTRPDEPITAGLASGPGPGPEALTMNGLAAQWQTGHDLVSQLAGQPGASPALAWLASRLGVGL